MINKIFKNKKRTLIILSAFALLFLIIFTYFFKKKDVATKPSDYTYKKAEPTKEDENFIQNDEEENYSEDNNKKDDTTIENGEGDFDYETMYKGELAFSEALTDLHNRYPWYSKFPVDNNEYVIVWDFEREQFRIRLKISKNSAQSLKDSLTEKAVNDIKRLTEEMADQYTYYVLFLD